MKVRAVRGSELRGDGRAINIVVIFSIFSSNKIIKDKKKLKFLFIIQFANYFYVSLLFRLCFLRISLRLPFMSLSNQNNNQFVSALNHFHELGLLRRRRLRLLHVRRCCWFSENSGNFSFPKMMMLMLLGGEMTTRIPAKTRQHLNPDQTLSREE